VSGEAAVKLRRRDPSRIDNARPLGDAWLLAAALGVAGIAALLLPHTRHSTAHEASISSLVAASTAASRPVEPRLSGGFGWAPLRSATRGAESDDDPTLASAIGTALQRARSESTPPARHAAGVAQLLAGRPRDALSSLSAAAESANEPRVWSDLAAALFETSTHYAAPELLADALAAADRALSFDDGFAEALFNRALIIERLGLRDDARHAWQRYLTADGTSGWSVEARQHLRTLAPEQSFLQVLDRDYERLCADASAVQALARHDPQEARARGEMELLGRWGRAVAKGDRSAAERQLRIVRELGGELARYNGDRMLERAVAAIDAADESMPAVLASAHADYDAGLQIFQARRPVEAEPILRRAAKAFERARSPMALRASFFAANTAFEQGRQDEAQRELQRLLAVAPAELLAFRAQLQWQLGSCHATGARWGEAIRFLDQATAAFERLGEVQNACEVRRIIAVIYDRIGDPATAWTHRVVALRGVGRQSDFALEKAVSSIAGAAMLRRKWQTAVSFLTLEIDVARRIHDDVQLADALLIRAAVRQRLPDLSGARADLADAEVVSGRSKDVAYGTYLRAARLRVRAMLADSGAEANAELTEVIGFYSTRSDRMQLPGLFLQRARALRKSGDSAGAVADLERGITELETHRGSLPQGEARWGAFHADEELFDEAIDLAMDDNDVARAFAFAERARARALLDSYGRPPSFDYRRLPAGTVVVEYAALPSQLVIFTSDASGIQAVSESYDRKNLDGETDALSRALESNDTVAAKQAAIALHPHLIAPIAPRLLGAKTVVFVPDALTATVPFSALVDSRGEYLLERYAIVVSPSAAVFAAAAERRRGMAAPRSVLVIANPEPGADADALAFVDAEAGRVSRAYGRADRLQNDEAQFEELSKRAASADVIHFAGHAIGDDSGFEPASIVLRDKGKERRIAVGEIARLRLPRTSVVVLAGCSTARGERRGSEGVMSVAHGFLTAGTPSVIATLWPISDAMSAELFPRLHARLAEGLSPAEALRAVQLESIHRGDIPASLWAALQDIGS
jgi:CHAT domain-containing protein/tetratricopeptide (TPR) repeat protein